MSRLAGSRKRNASTWEASGQRYYQWRGYSALSIWAITGTVKFSYGEIYA